MNATKKGDQFGRLFFSIRKRSVYTCKALSSVAAKAASFTPSEYVG